MFAAQIKNSPAMLINPLINVMIPAARQAARGLLRDFGEAEQLRYSVKGTNDFLAAADMRAEDILCEELSQARPNFDILAEERGEVLNQLSRKKSNTRWIIDPLDGTRNFMHGFPSFAISLAAEADGEIIAGLIYTPLNGEMFTAAKGEGAYLNNQRLRVSNCAHVQNALLAYGRMGNKWMQGIFNVMRAGGHPRQLGSVALSLAYVAAARLDGFLTGDAKIWDVAAGIIIVREAGGIATDLDDQHLQLEQKPLSVIACAAALHTPLCATIKQ